MRRAALLLAALPLLAGCDLSMEDQPKHETESSSTLWDGGPNVQPAPPGAIAIGARERDEALKSEPPVTLALVERGKQRYAIYCSPCHGATGAGDGPVVGRGFPRPASFADPKLANMDKRRVVDVITRGYGVMYDFADRIEPADRWAIANYVKALQRAAADRQAAK